MNRDRNALRRRRNSRRAPLAAATRRMGLEGLERRQLFALVGVNLELPFVVTQAGTQTYNATSHAYDVNSFPLQLQLNSSGSQVFSIANATSATRTTQVHIFVNNSGGLMSGDATRDDLLVVGKVTVGSTTYDGVLLRGEILPGGAFGYADNSATFDFRFSVTGGLLAANYFAGKDIGMVMQVENSTYLPNKFNGSWSGRPKATIGPIESTTSGGPSLTSISGHVYVDANNNGVRDTGETPIPGTTVKATGVNSDGTFTTTTTTDSNGFYLFSNIPAGQYRIDETQPASYLDGIDAVGTVNGTPSGTVLPPDSLSSIGVPVNGVGVDYDFGEIGSSVSGYVYHDANNDGIFQGTESPIPGTTVTLTGKDSSGANVNLTATTDANGFYSFTGLKPADANGYTLTETQPAGYNDGKDTIGTPGGTTANDQFSAINLPVGFNGVNNNFGELRPSSISGYVYHDANNDGTFQNTESPIANVAVVLTGTDDLGQAVSLATTTNALGYYEFTGLRAGTYQLNETQPVAYLDGKDTVGTPGGATTNDQFANITLPENYAGVNNNFGELLPASIAGYVYYDSNNDGSRAGEAPISGTTVTLTGTDDLGNAISLTTTTSATGYYEFTGLRPGTYQLDETQPAGYLDGKDTIGTPGGNTANDQFNTITLASGVNGVENNLGELLPAAITGFVYVDANNNGTLESGETVLSGVTLTLTGTDDLGNPVTLTTTTNTNGFYAFTDLRPGTYTVTETQPASYLDGKDTADNVTPIANSATTDVVPSLTIVAGQTDEQNNFGELVPAQISGYVYYDANNNGIKESGEAPIPGTTVTLTGVSDLGQSVTFTTTTNSSGYYEFTALRPGTYQIDETQPAGYLDGKDTIGTPGGTTTNDKFSNISIASGTNGQNNNFGELLPASLGDRVWVDANKNGVQDSGEANVPNVTVTLYDASNVAIGSTTTNASGNYSFTNLLPGTYSVGFTLPVGYVFTTQDAGSNDAADSDANTSTGRTASVTLAAGEYNPTLDAGVVPLTGAIDITKYVNPAVNNGGGEGLTPGYWKQTQHFNQWYNYVPTGVGASNYDAVFGLNASQDDASMTLLGALGRGGGGKAALGRHAAAALLNAANPFVSYAYTTAQIISMVKAAYLSGDYETTKNLLAAENEKEADLSTPASSTTAPTGYGYDANTLATAPTVVAGTQLTFTFVVRNTGDTPIINVIVRDDNATPSNTADDFTPSAVTNADHTYNIGDDNNDGILDIGELWIYTKSYAASGGTYTNTATVVGTPIDTRGNTLPNVSDSDIAIYSVNAPPATTTISGKKFRDVTGNGLTADDVPLAGITIKLYKDVNNDGLLTSADGAAIKTTVTASNGSYSFSGLATGKYLVQEVVTGDYVRTTPALQDYYAVNASTGGQTYAGFDFANFDKNDCFCAFGSYYFMVNGKKVTDLRGNTNQGDKVQVVFTIKAGYSNVQVSLVSYKASAAYFDADTAYLQQVYQSQTGTYGPGTYTMTVYNPDCYYQVDFVCGAVIDTFGPAGSNIFYTPQNRLISADNDGCNACFCGSSTISGTVFKDLDNDGDIDANEGGIKNVKVVLTGYNDLGQYVEATDYTDTDGFYQFTGLRDGNYKVTETQPTDYNDGKDDLGSLGGTLGNDVFSNISISGGNKDGINYNFGEISKTSSGPVLACDMTATIGFWQNKNGQALIKAMNGSSSCTKLGNWLAANFPNLFGNTTGTACNLAGKTNTQVADAFVKLFNVKGTKVEAQVMATALAVYATDSDLAGGTYAKSYGFIVNTSGTGAATYNVGDNGSAIGLTNYKSYTISQILAAANNIDAFDASSTTQTKVNNLFTAINETGDI